MTTTRKSFFAAALTASTLIVVIPSPPALAQTGKDAPPATTVLTFVNRLVINPPQVVAFGYFPTIQGLPGPLFSGTPGEGTAYFTWSLDASGAAVISNGDPNAAGGLSTAILRSGENLNIYYNPSPNQNWNDPASFSAGQLIATFKSGTGTQTGAGPVALVTQSYTLDSSQDFTFNGQAYNLAQLLPSGFTFLALGGNIPVGNSNPPAPPLVFTAAGSALAGPVASLGSIAQRR
jgi:hypothetical protein